MNAALCPFCTEGPIERDFFGQPCEINGVLCCEVCLDLSDEDFLLPPLVRIVPRRCEITSLIDGEEPVQCSHQAYWQYNGTAVCLEDIKAMARMNSDNEEAFAPALADDWLVALENKYIELAKQEVEARQRQGLPLSPEWVDALERKHNALAQLEIVAVEMEQLEREVKGSNS